MRLKSLTSIFASLSVLALWLAVPAYAADKAEPVAKTVACKDGTTEHATKGACSHHGGVAKGGASASAQANKSDEHGHSGESHNNSKDKK